MPCRSLRWFIGIAISWDCWLPLSLGNLHVSFCYHESYFTERGIHISPRSEVYHTPELVLITKLTDGDQYYQPLT